jgi:hypothetical protein
MDFQWADSTYATKRVEDGRDGFIGLELYRTARDGQTSRVATIVFWDAMGQFFLETLGTDLPLEVVERLIAEARATIATG